MNWAFSKLNEMSIKENHLSELTKETDLTQIDIEELDKPFFEVDRDCIEDKGATLESDDIPKVKEEDIENTEKSIVTDEGKVKIKEEIGWSDEIINAISFVEEYEIYKNAGLQEDEINGKKCLIQLDLDMEQKDSMGRTNKERMALGLAPINKEHKTIELHHIGQHPDSPLAELTMEQHRGKGNDTILHDKTKESEIDRNKFNTEKANYWKDRVGGIDENDGGY